MNQKSPPEDLITARQPQDILAYLPHVLGYWPDDSLVVLAMRGKQAGASLRLDLPARGSDLSDYREYAETLARHVSSDGAADGCLVALYAGVDWSDAEDPGYDQLVLALGLALAGFGLPMREAWWIGETSWRDYLCRDAECCELSGKSLQDIKQSSMSAELVFRGSSYGASLPEVTALPLLSAAKRSRARKAFQREEAMLASARAGDPVFETALHLWDAALRVTTFAVQGRGTKTRKIQATGNAVGYDRQLSSQSLGFLGATLSNLHLRDAVMVLALTDREQADWAASAEFLLGSSEVTPNWRRLARFEELLRHIAAVHISGRSGRQPDGQSSTGSGEGAARLNAAAAALSILAWIEWCRGRGSRAGSYVDSALSLVPGYRLAELFRELLGAGLLCCWAKNQRTAWQGSGPIVA